jgi:amino acid adenylation domain-containing protein
MKSRTVLEVIAEAVAAQPDSIAMVSGDEQITYGAVDRLSNRLARRLSRCSVGPEDVVALAMDRSVGMVVAMLAIWKAGAAYLPLDSRDPPERLRGILVDARSKVLLFDGDEPRWAPDFCTPMRITPRLADFGDGLDLPLEPSIREEHPAYVLYTSGSTGAPKGVVVAHRSLVNHMQWMAETFRYEREERIVLKTPTTFDASVWEIFAPLMAGGRMIIARPRGERDPGYLRGLLLDHAATTIQLVPALLEACLSFEVFAGASNLTRVFCGGDRLLEGAIRAFVTARPDVPLYNLYGPTEATIDATCCQSVPGAAAEAGTIGWPISGVEVWIADRTFTPVAPGDVGEILIGGSALARGYLNDRARTAEKFVPDPFGGRPGNRVYRTGDLGVRLDDGQVAFRGRGDDLVKVRGFRVELGEVLAAVMSHELVREAEVVKRELAGESVLIGYVVARDARGIDVPALREFLAFHLPDYMLPHAIIALDALPRTAHGKVDRRALPLPEAQWPAQPPSSAPTRNELERTLAEIWSSVLGVPAPGIDDNFFQLGGDSIRCLKVISRAKQKGLEVSLDDMFRHQTIRSIAENLGRPLGSRVNGAPSEPFSLLAADEKEGLEPDVEDAYPMSSIQKALYFLSQTSLRYEIYVTSLEIEAPFSESVLRRSLDILTSRHPWLRTSFDIGGFREPMQIVRKAAVVPIEVHDLTALADERRGEAVREWIDKQRSTRAAFGSGSFLKVHVHLLGPAHFQITFLEPVFDGWSVASMVAETLLTYHDLLRGKEPALPPSSDVTYRDFIKLERDASTSAECEGYWQRILADWPSIPLPRPSTTPAKGTQTNPVGRQVVEISDEVSSAIQQLSAQASVPLKSLLFAVHAKVLAFISGGSTAISGMMMNGRPEEIGGEHLLGIFLNTVPVKLEVGDGSWLDLARAAFTAEAAAIPYRRFPMALMQTRTGISPLFEAAFNFTHFHVFDTLKSLEELRIRQYIAWDQTFFPLMAQFHLDAFSGKLMLALDYDASQFSERLVQSWAEYYAEALTRMARAPREGHRGAPLLTERQKATRLRKTFGPSIRAKMIRSVPEMIAESVRMLPDAIAVQYGDTQISYRELDRMSNRLAQRLQDLGAGPEYRVGIAMSPSIPLLVAIVAVLKTGGAYVPIDPSLPIRRWEYVLRDSRLGLVLVDTDTVGRLPPTKVATLTVTDESISTNDASDAPLRQLHLPDALAYVLYTSGTSGDPKGVEVSRLALSNFLTSMAHTPGLGESDALMATTAISFDISGLELLGPLVTCGRLLLLDRATVTDGFRLADEIIAHRPTIVQGTPSTWRMLLKAGLAPSAQLRIFCGGEKLTRETADELLARSAQVWNLYGPTETTIWSSVSRVERGVDDIPLGRPIANTSLHILDGSRGPSPQLATRGLLHIGGLGLARGYCGRPDWTAELFVPDESARRIGERMYVTGDVAFYSENGEIHHAGRRDDQVKIRGVRIELGEIEAAIRRFKGVAQAVVRAFASPSGSSRLAAYVVPSPGRQISWPELRAFLRERLVEAMIPSHYVAMGRFQLTTSGKVDRKSLPDPVGSRVAYVEPVAPETTVDRDGQRWTSHRKRIEQLSSDKRELLEFFTRQEPGQTSTDPEPPRPGTEERLAGIWSDVLGVDRVGRNDDFFELGGDSILVIQLVAMSQKQGLPIGVHDVFQNPTIAALGGAVERAAAGRPLAAGSEIEVGGPLAARVADGVEDVYPLTPMQDGILYQVLRREGRSAYHVQWSFDLEGDFDRSAFERAWETIVRRHSVLRTAIRWIGREEPAQVVLDHVPARVRYEDWSDLSEQDLSAKLEAAREADLRAGFDLSRPPLVRIAIFRAAARRHHFFVSHHHIVMDGWSQQLFIKEIAQCYREIRRGESPSATAAAPYKRFVNWILGQDQDALRAFWSQELESLHSILRQGPTIASASSRAPLEGGQKTLSVALSESSSDAVRSFAKGHRLTLSVVIQAAWSLTLRQFSGREEVVYGMTLSGRSAGIDGIDSMLGLFINTLPFVVRFSSGRPIVRWMQDLMRKQSDVILRESTPLSLVRECAAMPGDLPMFDALFVFENIRQDSLGGWEKADLFVKNLAVSVDEAYALVLVGHPGACLSLELKYDSSRVPASEARLMLWFLEQALGELAVVGQTETLADVESRLAERLRDFRAQARKERRVAGGNAPGAQNARKLSS